MLLLILVCIIDFKLISSSLVRQAFTIKSRAKVNKGMPKIDIYLVRHGETTANRDEILQGHCDYPLTDLGILQAKEVGIGLKDISWDFIYCSDLPRAVHSLDLLLSENTNRSDNMAVVQTELIRELNFGVRESMRRGLSLKEAKEIFAKKNGIAVKDVVDTSESDSDVSIRQIKFLQTVKEEFLSRSSSGEMDRPFKVLCMTHGGFIRRFLRFQCNYPSPDSIKNCSVSILSMELEKSEGSESFDKYSLATEEDKVNIVYFKEE